MVGRPDRSSAEVCRKDYRSPRRIWAVSWVSPLLRYRPHRVLYAFDPSRTAILLIGGDKAGNDRWYQTNIPLAEKLYDRYLEERKESDYGQKIQ